jgi:hypothetical protein
MVPIIDDKNAVNTRLFVVVKVIYATIRVHAVQNRLAGKYLFNHSLTLWFMDTYSQEYI